MPVFRRMNWARGSESGLFIGERIYHVSGQPYYDKTLINWRTGERWFCTEQEAIAAGWRKAKV
jgi:hypothetical protein